MLAVVVSCFGFTRGPPPCRCPPGHFPATRGHSYRLLGMVGGSISAGRGFWPSPTYFKVVSSAVRKPTMFPARFSLGSFLEFETHGWHDFIICPK